MPPPASVPFELEWRAPPGCPDRDDARARVERFLGRSVGRAGDPEVRAQVEIVAEDGLFVASLRTADGERVLSAERCDVAADGAAYVVAAMIDPDVDPPATEEPPSATSTTPPASTTPPSTTPRTTAPPKRARDRVRGAVRIGAGVGVGPLPSVAPGLVGAAAITWRRLRVELGAAHWFAREARLPDRPNTGGDIRLTTGNARICPLAVLRPIEVPLCAGVEIGSMHGSGVGIDVPTSTRLLWVALTASAGVIWMPSPWVGLWADAALVVPVSRPIFEAENVGEIHQPAPAAFAGTLGLEARFP
jgi:hypothetical protein